MHDKHSVAVRASQRLRREHLDRTRRVYSQNTRPRRERERSRSGNGDRDIRKDAAFSSLRTASDALDNPRDDSSSVASVGRLKPLLAARRRIGESSVIMCSFSV